MRCQIVPALALAASLLASPVASWAQSPPVETPSGPRAGDRVAAGVGLLLGSVGLGALASYTGAFADGGEGPGVAIGVVGVVLLVVGIVEITRGAREWTQAPRPVSVGPGGLVVRF